MGPVAMEEEEEGDLEEEELEGRDSLPLLQGAEAR